VNATTPPPPGRPITASVDGAQLVPSFGMKHEKACPNGCHPPTVSIALGVMGELERPVMMTMHVDNAEIFLAWLQREISAARGIPTQ
jgi:hypothetical protein